MKSKVSLMLPLVFYVAAQLCFASCASENAELNTIDKHKIDKNAQFSKQAPVISSPDISLTKNIKVNNLKEVDFANFTYPATKEIAKITGLSEISLNDGSVIARDNAGDISLTMGLSYIYLGNITGRDKIPDATVVLTYATGGSGISECVYLYTMKDGMLELLWSFDTGDRSDGGLRNIYSEGENLVVETFNSDGLGACCTNSFAKSTYKWTGEKFELISTRRLANPSGAASPVYSNLKRQ